MKEGDVVSSLSEFLVCQNQDCANTASICHKNHFRDIHLNVTNGKKSTHKSIAFDESPQFINFFNIARIQNCITKKLQATLQGFKTNMDMLVQTALYNSQIFGDIFSSNATAMNEYFYLRSIQKGNQLTVVASFSDQLCFSLALSQQNKLLRVYRELCKYSPEWQQLNNEFNFASGINSSHLQLFIDKQTQYFTEYCQTLINQHKNLSINEYLQLRSTSKQYQNDIYYYSNQFTTFLTSKYQTNPAEQGLFTAIQYYHNFWEYFFVLIDTSKNAVKYFQEEIGFYKEYQNAMNSSSLSQSFLSFRMWRINHKVSTVLPSLKNPFFLETYIYSFIQELIEKKLFFPEQKINYDYKVFAGYLKDYVKFVVDKGESFNFIRYRQYFEFRRKNEKLQESLQKNKDIIYDKKYFVDYCHNEFGEGNKLGVKKYKKYQEKRNQEDQEKEQSFKVQIQTLKEALVQEEKEHFYELIFLNFINYLRENKLTPTKDNYTHYRSQILKNIDESYVQEEEAKYRQNLNQAAEDQIKSTSNEKDKIIVKEEINKAEEQIAEIIGEEARSSASQSEEGQIEVCPCCNDNPYDCKEPECVVMGCCTACMLD